MTSPSFPFSTALITGASSGIGRALALVLAQGGVRLALTARRQSELEDIVRMARQLGSEAFIFPADLSRPAEAFRVAAEAENGLGRIDLLIANAGVGKTAPLVNLPWEDIERMMMVNALGSMAIIRAVLPGMIAQGSGVIAGISSLAAYRGMPFSSAYSASKAALSTFLESMRVETRRQGISVIDIHPGYIRTPMTAVNKHPMPFLMEVDRAASLILRAILRKKPVYDFPWQMGWLLRIARLLPPSFFDRVVERSVPGRR
ncbi:MAG: SDR family NAD(P)-dependent oxidoreductase [Acidobacteria bacterium]|nr:SDR family NAD(P)-dependent oxidoreductase [Acidobacteriota bacterium]MBI3655808.1 SDR family NAD(P)-dependent oxidoreductase [Acidobacteriota bacterium]